MNAAHPSGAAAVVLTAGSGGSALPGKPKPLHPICGKPILMFVLEQIEASQIDRAVIVTGETSDEIERLVLERGFETRFDVVCQSVARGSADAALLGAETLSGDDFEVAASDDVVIVAGDVVMLGAEQLDSLVDHHKSNGVAATVLSADSEGTSSVYCVRRELLIPALRRVRPDNEAGALLLPDVIEVLASTGHKVDSLMVEERTVAGIDDGFDLAQVQAGIRSEINDGWLRKGVLMVDPQNTYIDATVTIGEAVTLLPGVLLEGATVIGNGARIGPNTHLVDTTVGDNAVADMTSAIGSIIGPRAIVGPFAALGAGVEITPDTVTGSMYSQD